MDSANLKDLKYYAKHPEQKEKIQLIMNFARPQSDEEVPDPYYDNRFQLVYDLLDEACDAVIEKYNGR